MNYIPQECGFAVVFFLLSQKDPALTFMAEIVVLNFSKRLQKAIFSGSPSGCSFRKQQF